MMLKIALWSMGPGRVARACMHKRSCVMQRAAEGEDSRDQDMPVVIEMSSEPQKQLQVCRWRTLRLCCADHKCCAD
jgi:hypothetical protein